MSFKIILLFVYVHNNIVSTSWFRFVEFGKFVYIIHLNCHNWKIEKKIVIPSRYLLFTYDLLTSVYLLADIDLSLFYDTEMEIVAIGNAWYLGEIDFHANRLFWIGILFNYYRVVSIIISKYLLYIIHTLYIYIHILLSTLIPLRYRFQVVIEFGVCNKTLVGQILNLAIMDRI